MPWIGICECSWKSDPIPNRNMVGKAMDNHAWIAYTSTPWVGSRTHKVAPVRHDDYTIVPV